jgi:Icc-related predicted phosphoesterase
MFIQLNWNCGGFVRLTLISDTHGVHPALPKGDVLLHAGDITHLGSFAELRREVEWLKSLPFEHIIYVPGNHDCCTFNLFQIKKETELRKFLAPIHYLRDSSVVISGVRFYGAPWVPPHSGVWDDADMQSVWQDIPSDTQVLVTHTPPRGIFDSGYGCPELRKVVNKLPNLKLHVFGHVEENHGQIEIGKTLFVNAAISTRRGDGSPRRPLSVQFSPSHASAHA